VGRRLLAWLDTLCLAVTPFALILVIVACLVLVERGTALARQMRHLETDGARVRATVARGYSPGSELLALAWTDASGRETYDVIRVAHYPSEAYEHLRKGDRVDILYVPDSENSGAVLTAHLDHYRRPRTHYGDVLVMLLCAWVPLAIRPDILYLGLIDDLAGLIRRTVVHES